MSWDLEFFKPIEVPGSQKKLATLRDAVEYMTSLPRAQRGADYWWPAVTLLPIIGERGGCMFLAERTVAFGLRKGVNDEPVFDQPHKTTHWAKRKLKRDE
jgi:hypothetical protein